MSHSSLDANLNGRGLRIAIVAARFNAFCVDKLFSGAIHALEQHGVNESDVLVVRVPGAFELPIAAQKVAATGKYDAIVALGAVIRGATPHFDYVCQECASGLTRASLDSGVPIAFGVLTTENEAQAMERAGVATVANAQSGSVPGSTHVETLTGNKGADAAMCAIEMANLVRELRGRSQ